MKESKVMYFLGLLSRKERKRFRSYVDSEFFNRREDCRKLLTLLARNLTSADTPPDDEYLFREIYGTAPFNHARLKKVKTALMDLLTKFLSLTAFQADPTAGQRFLLHKLNGMGEDRYFVAYHAQALRNLESAGVPEADYFDERMALAEQFNAFVERGPRRMEADHLQHAMESLSNAFLVRMLKFALRSVTRRPDRAGDEFWPWIRPVTTYIAGTEAQQVPLVRIYYALYQALIRPEDRRAYDRVRDLLREFGGEISREEAYNTYTAALNHCTRHINAGDLDYRQELFDLYTEMLRREILIDKGCISIWHYKNIIAIAARIGEIAWAIGFMEGFEDRLKGDYKQNAVHFNRGVLAFFEGKYETAETWFNLVLQDFKDIFYGLDCRMLLLRIYYETGNDIGMESLCHSFRMYLDRTRALPLERKQHYKLFIGLYRRMINLSPGDDVRIARLRSEVEATGNPVGWRAWLLEKIDLLART